MTDLDLFAWNAPKRTRAEEILEQFVEYHRKNPEVWELFKKFSFEAISSGREYFSAKAVYERIRWFTDIETTGDTVKLSNTFTAYYARLFHVACPEHDGFFRCKRLVSDDRNATGKSADDFDADEDGGDEKFIIDRLTKILNDPNAKDDSPPVGG